MTTLTVRTDAAVDQALAALTADGTSTSDAVRQAILAAARERAYAEMEAESLALLSDPDEQADARRVQAEMDALRAW